MSDAYVGEPRRQIGAAECAADWSLAWAGREAISQNVNPWPSTGRV